MNGSEAAPSPTCRGLFGPERVGEGNLSRLVAHFALITRCEHIIDEAISRSDLLIVSALQRTSSLCLDLLEASACEQRNVRTGCPPILEACPTPLHATYPCLVAWNLLQHLTEMERSDKGNTEPNRVE